MPHLIILLVFLIIIFGPFISIWSLNTLFNLGIDYTFKTWLAAIILSSIIYGSSQSGNKS